MTSKRTTPPGRRAQRGLSMIEVLVSLLVVSVGVLALGGLLATATRYGKTSEFRAVATLLANDYVDRIRANKPALNPAATPAGVATAYDLTGDYASWGEAPDGPVDCATPAACTAAEIAARDIAEWQTAVFEGLPGGAAYVNLEADPMARPAADVWVAWLDPDASKDEAVGGDGDQRQECPPGFRGLTPQPRCAYFRVGL